MGEDTGVWVFGSGVTLDFCCAGVEGGAKSDSFMRSTLGCTGVFTSLVSSRIFFCIIWEGGRGVWVVVSVSCGDKPGLDSSSDSGGFCNAEVAATDGTIDSLGLMPSIDFDGDWVGCADGSLFFSSIAERLRRVKSGGDE